MNTLALLVAAAATAFAQNVTVPTTCINGTTAGSDTVLFTVPYTYQQVLSIIGDYQNLTWSGSPPGSVTLNGSDNTVGTARTYNLNGAHLIETILIYQKPPNGPYYEVHNTALVNVPSANLTFYIPYDGTTVTETCNGKASMFNFTANFCAYNVSLTRAVLHMAHLGDAERVGKFLGGANFTTCAALGAPSGSSGSPTVTMTAAVPSFTGQGSPLLPSLVVAVAAGIFALLLM